jgi:hypothetical protein
MKKILVVILAVVLISSIFANVYYINIIGHKTYLAPIYDINISKGESLPPQYFLHFVSGEPDTCYKFYRYYMMRFGKTVRVMVLNVRISEGPCLFVFNYVDHTIALGSCFVPGVTYRVVVNGVVETFIA